MVLRSASRLRRRAFFRVGRPVLWLRTLSWLAWKSINVIHSSSARLTKPPQVDRQAAEILASPLTCHPQPTDSRQSRPTAAVVTARHCSSTRN